MNIRMIQIAILMTSMLVPLGCKSLYGQSIRNETIQGGVAGAIIGGIVGNQNDETPEGIAIGAAVGAIAGKVLGDSRENSQRQQIAQQQFQRHCLLYTSPSPRDATLSRMPSSA